MNVKHNLVSPRNGEPVIAAIQDFITASYLLSRKDQFFDRRSFTQICSYFGDANMHIDIPPPTIWKPQRLWTGKQVFNVLMRPNKKSQIYVNVECKCNKIQQPDPKCYPQTMKPLPDLSPNDSWLVIVNSEIMCGVMDKATVGSGKKKSIFGVIMRDYGPHEAANAMNRVAKLCARYIGTSITRILWTQLRDCRKLWLFPWYQRCHPGTHLGFSEGCARRKGLHAMSGAHQPRQTWQARE
jgi:DNA-directed RNA polymerase III subunit RPC1